MKHLIFGMNTKEPAAGARELREHGMDGVVCGSFTPECAAALEAEGLEMYLSFGAYGVPKDGGTLAEDAFGQPRRWFSSGCPNDWDNAGKHLDAVLEKAAQFPQVRGILVDGARFASFASVEGMDSFFTCFCPNCMQAMADMGLDAETIRKTVGRLMTSRTPQPGDESALQQWLLFREKTVQCYMDQFAEKVHALRPDLLAGAFIFAPSLGAFVGQTAEACRSLDVISHMLYRHYPQIYGVACLSHEWAALIGGFGQNTAAFISACSPDHAFSVDKTPAQLLECGFPPDWVRAEVAHARGIYPASQQLWPIIQTDDDRVHETDRLAFEAGADAVAFFVYGHGEVPQF